MNLEPYNIKHIRIRTVDNPGWSIHVTPTFAVKREKLIDENYSDSDWFFQMNQEGYMQNAGDEYKLVRCFIETLNYFKIPFTEKLERYVPLLEYLQEWYANECDGFWEHCYVVRGEIDAYGNCYFEVELDETHAYLDEKAFETTGDMTTFQCRKEETKFIGEGKLEYAHLFLEQFREFSRVDVDDNIDEGDISVGIRLIVSDLDGTLLNKWHKSDAVIDAAIDTVLAKRQHFALATGRHLHKNHRVGLTFLDKKIYRIAMNGAIVYDPTGKLLVETPIEPAIIAKMHAQFPTVSFEWITKEAVLVERTKWQHFWSITKKSNRLRHWGKHLVAAVTGGYHYQASDIVSQSILKIDCRIADEATRKQFRAFLAEHQAELVDAGYQEDIFEITAANANKRNAVQFLANYLQIAEQHVAVYGNDRNDVLMLEHFEHSYAPNNSVPVALAAAHHVIGSSYEHSVAHHMTQL
ncbi:MAG: Imm53 family immunity protein [Aerococcaceae bacterium]|nr:Imm53 family immunity protein [Aerococcaceae bacterium]